MSGNSRIETLSHRGELRKGMCLAQKQILRETWRREGPHTAGRHQRQNQARGCSGSGSALAQPREEPLTWAHLTPRYPHGTTAEGFGVLKTFLLKYNKCSAKCTYKWTALWNFTYSPRLCKEPPDRYQLPQELFQSMPLPKGHYPILASASFTCFVLYRNGIRNSDRSPHSLRGTNPSPLIAHFYLRP